MPVTSFQVVNRSVISCRYSVAPWVHHRDLIHRFVMPLTSASRGRSRRITREYRHLVHVPSDLNPHSRYSAAYRVPILCYGMIIFSSTSMTASWRSHHQLTGGTSEPGSTDRIACYWSGLRTRVPPGLGGCSC